MIWLAVGRIRMSRLVLVIDDERPIRDLVSALLGEEGWPVRAYSSALEALRDIRAGAIDPDVVLLDMRMPGMDGPQFAEAVRVDHPEIPIVVMTAARDARQWAEAIGAAGYIPKPFDIDWLIDTVTRTVGEPEADDGTMQIVLPTAQPLIRLMAKGWAGFASPPLHAGIVSA